MLKTECFKGSGSGTCGICHSGFSSWEEEANCEISSQSFSISQWPAQPSINHPDSQRPFRRAHCGGTIRWSSGDTKILSGMAAGFPPGLGQGVIVVRLERKNARKNQKNRTHRWPLRREDHLPQGAWATTGCQSDFGPRGINPFAFGKYSAAHGA